MASLKYEKKRKKYKREQNRTDEMKKVYNLYVIGKHVEPAHTHDGLIVEKRRRVIDYFSLIILSISFRLIGSSSKI